MVKTKGLIANDIYHFNQIVEQKKHIQIEKRNNLKFLILRRNYHKRRICLIKTISSIVSDQKSDFKERRYFSKFYNSTGLHIVSSKLSIHFRILTKNINFYFLIEKLRSLFFEKLQMKKKKIRVFIIERVDFLSEISKEILINFIETIKNGILWIFTGKKLKKFKKKNRFSIKSFRFNLENKLRNVKYPILINKSEKKVGQYFTINTSIFKKKFGRVGKTTFPIIPKYSNKLFKKLSLFSQYSILLNFVFFKLFYSIKKLKIGVINKVFQNSAHLYFDQFFLNYFISLKIKKYSKKEFKKQLQCQYIELFFVVLMNIIN